MWKGEKVFCPVNGWDCPYYKNGECLIENPAEDCDDFVIFFPTMEEWENA